MTHLAAYPVHYHCDRIDSDEPTYVYYTSREDAENAGNEAPGYYTITECTEPECTED